MHEFVALYRQVVRRQLAAQTAEPQEMFIASSLTAAMHAIRAAALAAGTEEDLLDAVEDVEWSRSVGLGNN